LSFPTYPDLDGRTVIITGGASGIGAAFVHAFRSTNARVAFIDIQTQTGEALAAATGAYFFRCDVTDLDALRVAIESVGQTHGPASVLVNNAANDQRQNFEKVSADDFNWMMAVNFRHVYFASQAVLPQMRAVGRGSIINMSSVAWMAGAPSLQAYSAAKAAIVGFTNSLARDAAATASASMRSPRVW
jgi:NAD(P)-dependent dehydrogenase (short-subunit alcohol dehydrogenase family)